MLRVGQGYDIHQLVPDRELIIGGVNIPHHKGLLGHSDGDVLIHAIIDAIIGAGGFGDIGKFYPDDDIAFKGVSSRKLLKDLYSQLRIFGIKIQNIDSTIILQTPKLRDYIDDMINNIASDLDIHPRLINIKAKTNEKQDSVGTENSAIAHAIVLLDLPHVPINF
jgi:2-C-methyl-D-erythritol 2,4-cyclodiphosphate synthase